jgi:hypothetical protein
MILDFLKPKPAVARVSITTESKYFDTVVRLEIIEVHIDRWDFIDQLSTILNKYSGMDTKVMPWGAMLEKKYNNEQLFKRNLNNFMQELRSHNVIIEKDLRSLWM